MKSTHYEYIQHHVVVVDEKDELVLAIGEFCCQSQYKVVNFCLQLGHQLVDAFVRETLVETNNGCRELGVPPSDLSHKENSDERSAV